jgi:hypothetical protein
MILQLKPLIGLNDLTFGALPTEIIKQFGEPEEIEELNDEILDDHVLVYHYWQLGISFFFSTQRNNIFSSVEIDNKNATLFDQKIFELKENEVIALFKKNNVNVSENEHHEWGEKRISFDAINMDLYFANGNLNSVNYGINEIDSAFPYNPN